MLDRCDANGPIDASSPALRPASQILRAHADFVTALAAGKPSPIALTPQPEDFTARAVCCEELIERVRLHLTALIEEAAENDAQNRIREAELTAAIDAHLSDLAGDITGTLEAVAEGLREGRYDGCARGPFYRRR